MVLVGKDKGKTGKVSRVLPRKNMVMVDGINTKHVHERGKKKGAKGAVIDKTFPIHASNVKLHGKS